MTRTWLGPNVGLLVQFPETDYRTAYGPKNKPMDIHKMFAFFSLCFLKFQTLTHYRDWLLRYRKKCCVQKNEARDKYSHLYFAPLKQLLLCLFFGSTFVFLTAIVRCHPQTARRSGTGSSRSARWSRPSRSSCGRRGRSKPRWGAQSMGGHVWCMDGVSHHRWE